MSGCGTTTEVFTVVAKVKDCKSRDYYVLYLEEWFVNEEFIEDTILLDSWKKCLYIEFKDKKGITVMKFKKDENVFILN